ncbi:MBOAT family O-acyltransferase [Spongiivirga sp. MCCC 1A20706]|uniref:MBOAT family O-acyltransferase n=1 Tax=Spongiivirga sp. MCCC 1A20706 TaxID=3160963 RepID=UPI003977D5B8
MLLTSFVFYGWADWRFLALLILSILINYFLGKSIAIGKTEKVQKGYLYLGVCFNLGLLLYFKYFNFFYEGFFELISAFGFDGGHTTLKILVPLGISFFTFQTLGYLIDVYNEEIEPSQNLLSFSVFVSFFPKILSGPIERAADLLPQISKRQEFSYAQITDGLRQILWGLFTKVVVAENCASLVNPIFDNYESNPGSVLFLGAVFYAIQLYADFSGYSNMAIGVGKLFGIQLTRNFQTPFFSTNISDFWRKWHMSLTNWMMDYVFTPLSFIWRGYHKLGLVLAIITTFVLVGLWHGANWTFIVYGLLHGIYFIPLVYAGNINKSAIVAKGRLIPSVGETFKMVLLFILITLTAVFFRADTVVLGFKYLMEIFNLSVLELPNYFFNSNSLLVVFLVVLFLTIEWLNREKKHDFEIANLKGYQRWTSYILIFILLLLFGKSSETFIYFQF